jgi:hypothetical protein
MLDHRPIRIVSGGETGWPCRPMMPGAWRNVPPALCTAIAAEGARRGDMHTMLPWPIERMRSLPLGFYPGLFLTEALARYAVDAAGVFRMLIGPDTLMLLDGTSPPLHALNARMLLLEDDAQTRQYLRFFCGAVHGEAGPFRVVERLDGLMLNPDLDAHAVAQVQAAVRSIRRGRGANADVYTATVVYGTALFRARFRVKMRGMVEMLDDEPLLPNALAHAGTYDGLWEVFARWPGNALRLAR